MRRLRRMCWPRWILAAAALAVTACTPTITLVAPPGPTPSERVATPTFTPDPGTFTTDQTVSISVDTSGASIYYTTDGTVPTASSTLYTAPVSVTGNGHVVTIISVGILVGKSNSGLAAGSFKISHTISAVAGNGTAGSAGDGGTATAASLYYPAGLAVDPSGNLYIGDANNYRVRKVTNTGTISTVAGGNGYGTITPGPATSSAMRYPTAVALDATGAILYIADSSAHAVYRVTGGTIALFAGSSVGTGGFSGNGGAATSALLSGPCGLAVDSSGNVYIADRGNNVVRKVTVATGIIDAFAGNQAAGAGFAGDGGASGIAQLSSPEGVAVDTAGNVYIAETGNSRVRKVTMPLSTISTLAGGPSTNAAFQDGGAATSVLSQVGSVATDPSGNVYLTRGNTVLMVDTAGSMWIMAGTGTLGFSGDGGAAASANLSLSTSASFVSGLAVDSAGGIYFSDTNNHRVRRVQQ